jgi:hypothetical protein
MKTSGVFNFLACGLLVACGSTHHILGADNNDSGGVSDDIDSGATLDDAELADAAPVNDVNTDDPKTGCRLATLGTTGPYPSDVFSKWLDKTNDAGVAALLDQVLTPSLLSPYKMIVSLDISQNHHYSPQEVTVLENWVKAGGGFMTVTGYHGSPEPQNVNALLVPYGMSYDVNLVLNCGPAPITCPINQWTSHPITTGITSIGFGNGFAVLGSGKMLAHSGGYDVLEAKTYGSGHVVLWGDEWITLNENWIAHPEYQMQKFWQNIVDWMDPTSGCKVPMPPPN